MYYTSATDVVATITQGGASSGTATVTAIVITQAGVTSNIARDYGSVA